MAQGKGTQQGKQSLVRRFFATLGPGVITGAADDDPSGIATYSIAGAQFGTLFLWTALLTWPLMAAVQMTCARIGMVTGKGLAGVLRDRFPRPLLIVACLALLAANTLNIAADLAGMADSAAMLTGLNSHWFVVVFGAIIAAATLWLRYQQFASILKWLSLSLGAYVVTALLLHPDWSAVLRDTLSVSLPKTSEGWSTLVAILGTTISPYLFFWQASEEVDEVQERDEAKPLIRAHEQAPAELSRIRLDTYIGMAFSNIVAVFIMIATAVTLHAHHVTNIQTSSQAALALKPIAGDFAFLVFALGIIGCGLLAVPVLAGSAAYGMGEAFGWHVGLGRKFRRAKAFYAAIIAATLVGTGLNFVHIDPIKALFWSAVINGVAAVPIMVMIMLVASRRSAMGDFKVHAGLKAVGWLATAVMAAAAVGMFATMGA
ncbi:MAG TPA: Nramp family divalent metal transporter [Thermoanaerobaculia bacterium]|nr:Nramp family divalent metal transporter [Thermoanaerobaculia bacterium]